MRCRSVVRALTHDAMGHWIDPSLNGGPKVELISSSNQCSTTGVTKVKWYVLSCLWDSAYKRTLAANHKELGHVALVGKTLSQAI